jgi:hypothetical protein
MGVIGVDVDVTSARAAVDDDTKRTRVAASPSTPEGASCNVAADILERLPDGLGASAPELFLRAPQDARRATPAWYREEGRRRERLAAEGGVNAGRELACAVANYEHAHRLEWWSADWRSDDVSLLHARLRHEDRAEELGDLRVEDRLTCHVHQRWIHQCVHSSIHVNAVTRQRWCRNCELAMSVAVDEVAGRVTMCCSGCGRGPAGPALRVAVSCGASLRFSRAKRSTPASIARSGCETPPQADGVHRRGDDGRVA